VLHVLANGHYGIFRDELYFIVCGDRPDWGYVDQPAVVPLLASWSHAIFGDFLWGFRLLPALRSVAGGVVHIAGTDLSATGRIVLN
jgi:4-amino-4-deoxy-L-arabinose transferase-like glycosyltransferase